MMVMYVFRVDIKGKQVESPNLITGDITNLKKLFPKCPIWQARTEGVGNIYYPTEVEAKALYLAIVEHYAKCQVQDKDLPGGNFTGSFIVTCNQVETFDELIEFFENVCEFTSPKKLRDRVSRKQEKRRKIHDKANWDTVEALAKLGTLFPPTTAEIREHLNKKLAEYQRRMSESHYPHSLAIQLDERYRDAAYKIFVAEAVLTEKVRKVPLGALAKLRMDKDGKAFDPLTFVNACGVIAQYLETPLKALRTA